MNFLKNKIISRLVSCQVDQPNASEYYSNYFKITIYLWFLLSILLSILNTIVFLNSYWLGNQSLLNVTSTNDESTTNNLENFYQNDYQAQQSNSIAYFGLYRYCFKETTILVIIDNNTKTDSIENLKIKPYQSFFKCSGYFTQANTILNVYFIISTYMIGAACVLGYACVAISFLIAFTSPQFILYLSSFTQVLMGTLLDPSFKF